MTAPNVSVKILAENLASAALEQVRKDMGRLGDAARTTTRSTGATGRSFGDLVRGHLSLSASTKDVRKGMNAVEDGMRSLALRAAGLSGSVGQLSKGLLLLGGGGGALLTVAAAVGVVALAYNRINQPIKEAMKSTADFTAEMNRQADQVRTNTERLREHLRVVYGAKQQGLFGPAAAAPIPIPVALAGQFAFRPPAAAPGQQPNVVDVAAMKAVVAFGRAEGAEARREREREAERQRREDEKALEEARLARAQDRAALTRMILAPENRPGAPRIIGPGRMQRADGEGPPGMAPLSSQPTTQDALAMAVLGIGGFAQASTAGLAGIADFAGGVVTGGLKLGDKTLLGANPFIGSLLTVGSGLFRMFDRSAERRHRELVDSIQKTAKLVGLQRVRLVVVNGRGDVIADLREAETHDAVSREPGYVGMTG